MITTKDGQWERPQRTCGVCVCVCVAVGKAHRNKAKYMNTHTQRYVFTTSRGQPQGKVRVHLFDGYSSNTDTDVHWCADAPLYPATEF